MRKGAHANVPERRRQLHAVHARAPVEPLLRDLLDAVGDLQLLDPGEAEGALADAPQRARHPQAAEHRASAEGIAADLLETLADLQLLDLVQGKRSGADAPERGRQAHAPQAPLHERLVADLAHGALHPKDLDLARPGIGAANARGRKQGAPRRIIAVRHHARRLPTREGRVGLHHEGERVAQVQCVDALGLVVPLVVLRLCQSPPPEGGHASLHGKAVLAGPVPRHALPRDAAQPPAHARHVLGQQQALPQRQPQPLFASSAPRRCAPLGLGGALLPALCAGLAAEAHRVAGARTRRGAGHG
mmetsp:Transcript_6646/g.18951  ORF Transcript_6646/g.18951 Transcript_6646/m.18951 type:complete len:303 (-) Transcript_6646:145-1053(-)